jgi:hypothetical protein
MTGTGDGSVEVVEEKPVMTTGLLTRLQAARLSGFSEATIRRREGTELKPVVIDGVHYHQETQVRSMMTVRRSWGAGSTTAVDGGTAADVFDLLQSGVAPVDIVMRLRLPPEVVKRLHAQWAELRGTFAVSPEDAEWLGAKSSAEVVSRVRAREDKATKTTEYALSATPQCSECQMNPSSVCVWCVRRRGSLATKDHRLEERTSEQAKEEVRVAFWAGWWPLGETSVRWRQSCTEWVPRERAADLLEMVKQDGDPSKADSKEGKP